jgi:Ca-activated chloride channel family protein
MSAARLASFEPQQPRTTLTPRSKTRAHPLRDRANLRLDVTMVIVPVTVTDAADRPLIDLPRERFRIFEDNIEQKISSFGAEDGPVSVGFVIDASSSMKGRMPASILAIQEFLKDTTPGDEFSLVRFSDQPDLVTAFTQDPNEILSALSRVQSAGWTALNDAICFGMQRMKTARNVRRALVVLTDGGDNNSRYSEWEVRNLARESDVRVYSIGILENPRLLDHLAADTGGRTFPVHKLDELPEVAARLSRDLRSQYLIGYSSSNEQNDGKYRRVRVELAEPKRDVPLKVHWRQGYFAPPD